MKVKKKPVIVEAREFTFENQNEIMDWCKGTYWSMAPFRAITGMTMQTLNGPVNVEYGEYVIKGIRGEFYPCKADIFAETYEAVNE